MANSLSLPSPGVVVVANSGNTSTEADRLELAQQEQTITDGLRTFVAVGRALTRIRVAKLYRSAGYSSFETYCQDRWGYQKSRAYQLIEAAGVVETVHNCGNAPTNEAQARELGKLPSGDQVGAWEEILRTAPNGVITAKLVKSVVAKRLPVNPPPGPNAQGTPAHAEPPEHDTPEAKDVTATIIRRVGEVVETFREALDLAVRLDALRDALDVCPGKRGKEGRQLKAEIQVVEEAFEVRLAELRK